MGTRRYLASVAVALLLVALMPAAPARAASVTSITVSGGISSTNFTSNVSGPSNGFVSVNVTTALGSMDLTTVSGVTTSTTFTVVIDVGASFTPIFVGSTGDVSDWTFNSSTHAVTVTATPQAFSFTMSTCNSTTCANQADEDDTGLLIAIADSSVSNDATFLTNYTGGFIATDAQSIEFPQFDSASKSLQFHLGATHLTHAGTQNEGFFNILVPKPVITGDWGLTFDPNSPPDIGATSDGASVTLQTPVYVAARGTFPEAFLFKSNTIHYSSPQIALKPKSSSSNTEPTQVDVGSGTGSTVTTLPLQLPSSGEFTREVTLNGGGASLFFADGTAITENGEPFTGKIDPPTSVAHAAGGLDHAVSLTATASSTAASAQSDASDLVFEPPIDLTIVLGGTLEANQALAQADRVVRIAPDGSITDAAGSATNRGIQVKASGLGTYGLASVLDLTSITSAPSIDVALPIDLPSDGMVAFPTTLEGAGASLTFAPGTAVTAEGSAFGGVIAAPAPAAAPEDVGSVAKISASSGETLAFSAPATLTLALPASTSANEVAPVSVAGGAIASCLTGVAGDASVISLATTGTFGLALPLAPGAVPVERDFLVQSGLHSQWAGESSAPTLCPGQTATLTLRLRNTGDIPWIGGTGTQVVLGTDPIGDTSVFDSGLAVAPLYGRDRLATQDETTVAPGTVGTFRFRVKAPVAAGDYRVNVRPVVEGVAWLEDEGIYLPITVR